MPQKGHVPFVGALSGRPGIPKDLRQACKTRGRGRRYLVKLSRRRWRNCCTTLDAHQPLSSRLWRAISATTTTTTETDSRRCRCVRAFPREKLLLESCACSCLQFVCLRCRHNNALPMWLHVAGKNSRGVRDQHY